MKFFRGPWVFPCAMALISAYCFVSSKSALTGISLAIAAILLLCFAIYVSVREL